MSKTINLTQGKVAVVSDCDYEYLSARKWQYNKMGYAVSGWENNRVLMHRLITNAPKGMDVDHINGDGLDNRRENLRVCTHAQNLQNSKRNTTNTSGFKGVSFNKSSGKWEAYINVSGKRIRLGRFKNAEEASAARDQAAIEYHGEFANLNSQDRGSLKVTR